MAVLINLYLEPDGSYPVSMLFAFCPDCQAVIHEDGSGHFPHCATVQEVVRLLIEELPEMTVPTDAGFDWSSVTGEAVATLRKPKTVPVPDAIVALAQESYVGRVNPADPEGARLHWLRHRFETPERAAQFASLMKLAGAHTSPESTVRVVIDPDSRKETPADEREPELVAWCAGTKKGPRAPAAK